MEFISQEPLTVDADATSSNEIKDSDSLSESPKLIQGNDDDLLTTQELADLLGLSKSWVQHNTSAKSIPHIKIGQAVRFRRGDIKEWIRKQRQDPI